MGKSTRDVLENFSQGKPFVSSGINLLAEINYLQTFTNAYKRKQTLPNRKILFVAVKFVLLE